MKFLNLGEKTSFFLKYLFRGLAWFGLLILIFIIFKNYVHLNFAEWLEPVFDTTRLIFAIYIVSELVFGIIPPELFMIWALRTGEIWDYVLLVFAFAVLSYLAGFAGFLFGNYLNKTVLFRYVRKRYLGKYHTLLQKFGVFLILVAALTPLPWSAISMLVGSLHYPTKKYLFWALFRFIRFAVYAAIIWEANIF
jgi:membrane protein DedA with SNARE-associated domain